MFPKCSVDVQNIATLREQSANIPRILRANWVRGRYIYIYIYIYVYILPLYDNVVGTGHTEYFLLKIEMKGYNNIINEKYFFGQQVKICIRTYVNM